MVDSSGPSSELKHTRHVPVRIKRSLTSEAGGKCANPGCPSVIVEFHHIDEWAVYRTHDERRMIAICPTCHAAVHGKSWRIPEATLLAWKRVPRAHRPRHYIYVQPAETHVVLVGSIRVTGAFSPIAIVPESSTSKLAYSLVHGDTICLDAKVILPDREPLIVEAGHCALPVSADFHVMQRSEHVRIELLTRPRDLLPVSLYRSLMLTDPLAFTSQEKLTVFEAAVEAPGRVRICGVWHDSDGDVIVVTRTAAHCYSIRSDRCIALQGPRGLMNGCDDGAVRWQSGNMGQAMLDVLKQVAAAVS